MVFENKELSISSSGLNEQRINGKLNCEHAGSTLDHEFYAKPIDECLEKAPNATVIALY